MRRRSCRGFSRNWRADDGLRRYLDSHPADPRCDRPPRPYSFHPGARRGWRAQHGRRLCEGIGWPRARHHIDRCRRWQRRWQLDRSDGRGLTGPPPDRPDRNILPRQGPSLHTRGARPARHVEGSLQSLLPGLASRRGAGSADHGGAIRPHRTDGAGQRRDSDRRSKRQDRLALHYSSTLDRAPRDATPSGSRCARRSACGKQTTASVARRRGASSKRSCNAYRRNGHRRRHKR